MEDGSWYDTAQICLNGHVINARARENPEHNQDFCARCGAETITECPDCRTPIRGYYHVPHVVSASRHRAPKFCCKCGKPYPWTESRLEAARGLADELSDLRPQEREDLKQSLDDLVKDTPNVPVAALTFKRLACKAGRGVAEAFKDILIGVVSETAKKLIWP